MKVPSSYKKTESIIGAIQRIESSKKVLSALSLPQEIILNLRRESLLKSALYSARIEGNTLEIKELSQSPKNSKIRRVKECQNLVKALSWVVEKYSSKKEAVKISEKDILEMHRQTMSGVSEYQTGAFRNEISGIFNQSGFAVYVAPSPQVARKLTSNLVEFVNTSEEHPLIKAFLAQFSFEKIHPFFDGNGRVGRLLTAAVLCREGYGMGGLVAVEEYIDQQRSLYYAALEEGATSFLEFSLTAFAVQCENLLDKALELKNKGLSLENTLLPRRQEILNIIRDHNLVNFDIIQRRFLSVNPRTLRFDLKYLIDRGFIVKKGATRGAFYAPSFS